MSGYISNTSDSTRQYITLLPVVNQTNALSRFFGSTVDQVFQPGNLQPVNAYIGQYPSYYNYTTDFYVSEPTRERELYQLDPGMVSFDASSNIAYSLVYSDLIGYLSSQGANVTQQSRMFENNDYCWSPPIDIDKITNYSQYFWFGDYTGSSDLPTLILTSPTNSYIGDGITVSFLLPDPISNISSSQETIAAYVNSVKISGIAVISNSVVLPLAPIDGDQVVVTRYDDLTYAILGQTTFPVTSFVNSTINVDNLSSGMRINLQDTSRIFSAWDNYVTGSGNTPYRQFWDETYLSDESNIHDRKTWDSVVESTFMVDGVGQSIRLTPDSLFDRDLDPQYVTIDRSSLDQNGWSLTNNWVHKDSYAWANTSFSNRQAERPIVEFIRDIELYQYGTNRISSIDGVLTTPNASLNGVAISFSQISSQTMGTVSVDNGKILFPGMILLVAQSTITASYNQQLYLVNQVSGKIVLQAISQNAGDVASVNFASGFGAKDTEVYFDGDSWKICQRWQENADPLFRLFDVNGVSLDDSSKYLNSTFKGSRIFGYALGDGLLDPILLRSLQYDNNGYIIFENDVVTRRSYTILNGIETEISGLYCYMVSDNSEIPVSLWHPVIANTSQDVMTRSGGVPYYDLPLNLIANPKSDDVTFASKSDWLYHFESEIKNQQVFSGNAFADNNWRDTARDLSLGDDVLQHIAPMLKIMLLASEPNFDLLASIRYADQEYNLFRNKFARKLTEFDKKSIMSPTATSQEWVSAVLAALKIAKSSSFPFYLSTMAGGYYFIPPTPAFLGVLPSYIPGLITDDTYPTPVVMIRGHDGSLTPAFSQYATGLVVFSGTFGTIIPSGTVLVGTNQKYYTTTNQFIVGVTTSVEIIANSPGVESNASEMTLYLVTPVTNITITILGDIDTTNGNGGWKDAIFVQLEKQIYNSISSPYSTFERPLFDLSYYLIGRFCPTEASGPFQNFNYPSYTDATYNRGEIQAILAPLFEQWAQNAQFDYRTNGTYDSTNPFTWNYRGLTDVFGSALPGHWRAIYRWYFDTDRPHVCPWEMLGFSDMPSWWISEYGSFYGSTNTKLWSDLENGLIQQGPRAGINLRYVRNGLSGVIPVDNLGNLLDPVSARIVSAPPNFTLACRPWENGDGSPVENIWINSPSYQYALAQIAFLTKPARFVEMGWDSINYGFSQFGDQWIDFRTNQRPLNAGNLVHGELNSSNSPVTVYGIQQWISDYLISANTSPSLLGNAVRGLDVRLIHRMAAFLSSDDLNVSADNFGVLPTEDVQVVFYQSPSTATETYSGVVIEWVGSGWKVIGYDIRNPVFNTIPPDTFGPKGILSLATTPEPIVVPWTPNTYYRLDQHVVYQGVTYFALVQHVSSAKFESNYWQVDSNTYPQAPRVIQYLNGIPNTLQSFPYGTEFKTIQQVADFLWGYERWLISRGWTFNVIGDDGVIRNWTKSVKDFLTWTQVNWAVGNLIALSPGAEELHFVATTGTILNVEDNRTGYYGLLDRSGLPIKSNDVSLSRLGSDLSLIGNNADIFAARVRLVDIEHALIFSNITIFNDVIYLPLFNMQQPRLKILGNKTINWVGRLSAPGYIVEGNAITPNYDRNVQDIQDAFDIEKSLRKDFTDYARHVIGYEARDYLENLLLAEVEQFEFYQGMIAQKGTPDVFSRLLRSTRVSANSDIEFLEEFAIRLCRFGTPIAPRITFFLNQSTVLTNPQFIRIGNSAIQLDPTWITMNTSDPRWIDLPPTTKPLFSNLPPPDPNNLIPNQVATAGFVRTTEVDYTLFHFFDIEPVYNSAISNSISAFSTQDLVWIYSDYPTQDWNVYQVFELGTQPNYIVNTVTTTENSSVQGLRIYLKYPHGLTTADEGKSVLVDGLAHSNPEIQGVQTIEVVNTITNWIEINQDGVQGYNFANTVNLYSPPNVRIFQPVRFSNTMTFQNSTLNFSDGDMAWIDSDQNNNSVSSVYTYINGSWSLSRLRPIHIDPSNITESMVYDIATEINIDPTSYTRTITSNNPILNDLVIVDPLTGYFPGAAAKEIDFKQEFDPAKYNASLVYNIVLDPWGDSQVGRVWWDLSTVRYLDPYTDQIGINNQRDLAEIDYRTQNWATIAPNTSVDVYEWTKSLLSPTDYIAQAIANTAGYGQVYNSDNPSYTQINIFDPSFNKDITYYYFWVSSLTVVPNVPFRSTSVSDIAMILQNPTAEDIPWFAPIMSDGMLVSGLMPYLNDTSTVLKVQTKEVADPSNHDQWFLMRPNDSSSLPPDWLWRHLLNSLAGFDEHVNILPFPSLNTYRSTGIFTGQNMFDIDSLSAGDRLGLMNARESFVGIINNIWATNPIVIQRPIGVSILSRNTPVSDYLVWNRPDDTFIIEPPPQNEWDYQVFSNDERNYLLLRPEFLSAITNNTTLRVLLDGTNLSDPQWSIWWFNPQIAQQVILENSLKSKVLPVIDALYNASDQIFTLAPAYEYSVSTYAARNLLTGLLSGNRVYVEQDETCEGFWVIYQYEPSSSLSDSYGFIVHRIQSYRTSDFYQIVDWYAQSFDNGLQTISFSANNPPQVSYPDTTTRDSTEGTSPANVFIEITNYGNWYWQYFVNGVWNTVAQQAATIALSANFYNSTLDVHAVNTALTSTVANRDGSWEIKVLADAIRYGGALTDSEINQVFFSMIHFVHSQQDDVDWVFKTSFMTVAGYAVPLEQTTIQTADVTDSLISYINEVKPYHVKIRDYTAQYAPDIDVANIRITDFDKPIYFDNTINAYRTLDPVLDLAILQTNSNYTDWYQNYLLPMTQDSSGYWLNPVRHMKITLAFDRVTDTDDGWDILAWDVDDWDLNESAYDTAYDRIRQYYAPLGGMPAQSDTAGLINSLFRFPAIPLIGNDLSNSSYDIDYQGIIENSGNVSVYINEQISNASYDPQYGRFDSNQNPTDLFVDVNHPEERVALVSDDTLNLLVTTLGTSGAPIQKVKYFKIYGDVSQPTLPYNSLPQSADNGLLVYFDGKRVNFGDDYTVDYFNKSITCLTTANTVSIRSFGFGGLGGIIEEHLLSYGQSNIVIVSSQTTDSIQVLFDGVVQNSSYSISNNTVSILSNLTANTDISVIVWDSPVTNTCEVKLQTIDLSTGSQQGNYYSYPLVNPDLITLPPHAGTIVEVNGLRLTPPLTYYGTITITNRYIAVDFDISNNTIIDLMIDGVYYSGLSIPRWTVGTVSNGVPFNLVGNPTSIVGSFVLYDRYLVSTDNSFMADEVIVVFYEDDLIDYQVVDGNVLISNSIVQSSSSALVTTFTNADVMGIQIRTYFASMDSVYPVSVSLPSAQYSMVSFGGSQLVPEVDYDFASVTEAFEQTPFGTSAFSEQYRANVMTIPLDPSNTIGKMVPIVAMFFTGMPASNITRLRQVTTTPADMRMQQKLTTGGWDTDYFDKPFSRWDLQNVWDFEYPRYPGNNTNPVQVYQINHSWEYLQQQPINSGYLLDDLTPTDNIISIGLNLDNFSPKLWPIQLIFLNNEWVWSGSVLTNPDPINNVLGVVWIGGERIEYTNLDYVPASFPTYPSSLVAPTILLSGLRRGTRGTSPINENRVSSVYFCNGTENTYLLSTNTVTDVQIKIGNANTIVWANYIQSFSSNVVTLSDIDHFWPNSANYIVNSVDTTIVFEQCPPDGSVLSIGSTINYNHPSGTLVTDGLTWK